ncbi:MAG: nuclear transport factor 2 family protein [Candidatus Marinimicrobia bacterium]|jgi:ketosteroid isomerase-like protein|nr:nuclear transport factor 2 family protein [Candidatus Neomarinimicrobiota bacterium]MBT4359458.1 nuclear transport factor 2 family protein [Candidatus Neomarinimicrobiota bacterium]MBT4715988.1 nuclear transport factor 2 family protein [Candidatus Neomarinimicrobiota bacterium]MBT4948079.1 nuclear transport factor 2 family protein [Candidatus Neomarinimicrobiota bacterium]MBT5270961.1 nuclear transport factor 2 family protein [Candidatus Neomarinimicrobiota bacterium]
MSITYKTLGSILGILIIFTTMISSCNIKDDLDTERRRLLNADKQFAQMSLDKGAAEAFNHFLTEDAMGMSHNQHPVVGREQIYQEMKVGQEDYELAWDPQRAEVAGSADMGWTWGKYVLSFNDEDGVEQKRYGKYLNIWTRQEDGQWKVAVDMGNSSPKPSE